MPMPPYPVLCGNPGCHQPAEFKIAARWGFGSIHELKTYELACPACLATLFAAARRRHRAYPDHPGEIRELPGIFELQHGGRDRTLVRREDLEVT